jgi:hypothetical protein
LVEQLSPTGERFREIGHWLFRGQPVDKALLPSAFREEKMPLRVKPFQDWPARVQVQAEFDSFSEFFLAADEAGLALPEDRHEVRELLRELSSDIGKLMTMWPPGSLLSAIALAQHHGIPTRLLDWSRSPYVAAYFAAAPIVRCKSDELSSRAIVVWAYNEDSHWEPGDEKDRVQIVTTPYANNANLAAQEGVHLLYRAAKPPTLHDRASRPGFDEFLLEANEMWDMVMPALRKFTLDQRHAGRLLKLLAKHGVTASSLFPGFGGVARALEEKRLWE